MNTNTTFTLLIVIILNNQKIPNITFGVEKHRNLLCPNLGTINLDVMITFRRKQQLAICYEF